MEIKLEEFGAELQKLAEEAITGVKAGVNEIAEDLLAISQRLAPLDEGGLMESGTVDPAINSGGNIVAKVGYNKEYALRMHEGIYNLGAISARKPSVDGMQVGRKFLSQPLTIYSTKYINHIISKMTGDNNG